MKMAVRLLEESKWTKDGRKYIWYIWETGLDGKNTKSFPKHIKLRQKQNVLKKNI